MSSFRGTPGAFAAIVFLGLLVDLGLILATPAGSGADVPQGESARATSIPSASLIKAQELAQVLRAPEAKRPLLLYVGFHFPYTQGHIPGSEYVGPASSPASLQQLRRRVEDLPRDKFIVIYCGCCPWNHCPNVKPAYEALHKLGFTKLKVLYLAENLGTDWLNRGYPVVKGE